MIGSGGVLAGTARNIKCLLCAGNVSKVALINRTAFKKMKVMQVEMNAADLLMTKHLFYLVIK